MKKLLARLAIIGLATAGLSTIGEVAKAEPAQAATVSNCTLVDAGPGYIIYGPSSSGRYATSCRFDYDWMEEVVLRMRDGYKMVNIRNVRCDWQYRVGC